MLRLRYIKKIIMQYQAELIIPILGIISGMVVPIAVFLWLYHDSKNKRATIIEISKNLDDKSKLDELLKIFDERKKEPIDYRRNGIITLFTGVGLFLFGVFFLGNIMQAVGALVSLVGLGTMIAGYLYPNTSQELTNAVEEFEKK
tara:strand:+ start:862 stop:1296 length:435 start_codon:yes stop_codon:yes gene_type:complete